MSQGRHKCRNDVFQTDSLIPTLKVVKVQPTEKDKEPTAGRKKEKARTEGLKKVEFSLDFSYLADEKGRGRAGHEARRPDPPPLPEPVRVDPDLVLREVLSDTELLCPRPASQSAQQEPPTQQDQPDCLEDVPLSADGENADDWPARDRKWSRGSSQSSRWSTCSSTTEEERLRLTRLFEELLLEIYPEGEEGKLTRRASEFKLRQAAAGRAKLNRHHSHCGYLQHFSRSESVFNLDAECTEEELQNKGLEELAGMLARLQRRVRDAGSLLVSRLEERDRLRAEHEGLCDLMTACLHALSRNKSSEDSEVRFSVGPAGGDSGFNEWTKAMKMVARLPDGVPPHFRKTLWLSLAEKHLASKNIFWSQVEKSIFSDRLNPDDQELSVQIVKDLHRTGCSLFCGSSGQHNQAVLKRVLLAYARWNKTVGYCQGLNMLAALILQVMQGCQSSTVKVMIYLIEGVLPDSYFADNLRGLSVDMAVFRDLLSLKVPHLSRHLDNLQQEAKESGTSYEPPLMDVFTMQWFLTIFCNCLPQGTVLRLWDLLFLEGDSVLIKAALVIWQNLTERLLSVRSADEFYSIMAVLTREMMEFGSMDANTIIKSMDLLSIPELNELREKYEFNISPWPLAAKKGLRIFYPQASQGPLGDDRRGGGGDMSRMTPISNHPDREKIALDISALKKQYWKLRERQRQAHIILSAACRNESYQSHQSSPALNHLLLGKSALKSVKARTRVPAETLHWRDAPREVEVEEPRDRRWSSGGPVGRERGVDERPRRRGAGAARRRPSTSSSSSSSTELCDSSDSGPEESQGPASLPVDSPATGASPEPPSSSATLLPVAVSTPSPPTSSGGSPFSPIPSPLPASSSPVSPSSPCPAELRPVPSRTHLTPSPSPIPSSPTPSDQASSQLKSSSASPVFMSDLICTTSRLQLTPSPSESRQQASDTSDDTDARLEAKPSPSSSSPTFRSDTRLGLSPSESPSYLRSSEASKDPSPDHSRQLLDEASRKRDDLMRILRENSELIGRFRHHSTSPTSEAPRPPFTPRLSSSHSPEEPEDIKDIRRRYSVDPFPPRGPAKPREVGIKLGLYSQTS